MTSGDPRSRFHPDAPDGAAQTDPLAERSVLVTLTHDLYDWYAMPDMVTHELERDRQALGLDRRKYVVHVLMRRYHEVLENGPGFDRKTGAAPPGRKK